MLKVYIEMNMMKILGQVVIMIIVLILILKWSLIVLL